MNKHLRLTGLLAGAIMVAAACSSTGASTAPSVAPSTAPSEAASVGADRGPVGHGRSGVAARADPEDRHDPRRHGPELRPVLVPQHGHERRTKASTPRPPRRPSSASARSSAPRSSSQWETPGWDLITAGSWGGRWDISIGSMSVTVGRAKVVDFTEPYYYDFGSVAVPTDSTIQSLAELDGGKTFCVGTATTYEQWLTGTLEIVDPNMPAAPTDSADHGAPDRQRVHPGRPGRAHVRRHRRPTSNGLGDAVKPRAPRSASSKARRSSRSRSRSRSTRAARTRRRSRRSSTRSSPRCTPTARVKGFSERVARARTSPPSREHIRLPRRCYGSRPDDSVVRARRIS